MNLTPQELEELLKESCAPKDRRETLKAVFAIPFLEQKAVFEACHDALTVRFEKDGDELLANGLAIASGVGTTISSVCRLTATILGYCTPGGDITTAGRAAAASLPPCVLKDALAHLEASKAEPRELGESKTWRRN